MTYLHQLRAHFTGHQLEVQQIGKTAEESNYVIGKFNTDNDTDITKQVFGQEINNLRKLKLTKKQDNGNETDSNTTIKNGNNDTKSDPSKLRLPLKFTNKPDTKQEKKEKPSTDFIFNGSKMASKVRICFFHLFIYLGLFIFIRLQIEDILNCLRFFFISIFSKPLHRIR